ncbi:neurotrophin-3 isoform X2 [Megalops cyprinoides]|uniref:neurotrophin-3 isoform X2 n=1 Tax=Megalops cyprinoides TaxID=118141 RepID=UPI0018640450|nr:neurotrophin-3 isoform X2 [Megalops cyprinoides]
MVTFITILQVNLVMSILLYVMFLAYLCGIKATSMDKRSPTQDPVNALVIKLLQADITRTKQRQAEAQDDKAEDVLPPAALDPPEEADYPERMPPSVYQPVLDIGAELLKQHKRYNSPRVLLSDRPPLQPPPLYLIDDYVGASEAANKTRKKRNVEHKSYRGEYSVCDSESQWVTDKTNAVDIRGHQVTVLGVIKTSGTEVKQYFYETKCRSAKPFKSGCRGIDDKHWNSQCKTSQTYVRALTSEKTSVGWRWIRIDTSCVCALSRKQRRT